MTKLTMTVGLPGSGKSTWARARVLEAPPGTVVRVNKDDLRRMLHADRYDGRRTEAEVEIAQEVLLRDLLSRGVGVICDDTGFGHEARLQAVAEDLGAEFVVVDDFLQVPVDECIANDLKRCDSVGESVIRKMYRKHIRYFTDVLAVTARPSLACRTRSSSTSTARLRT